MPRPRSKNLLGALAFLLKRPITAIVTVLLLLVVIAIDLALPFVIGLAINALQDHPQPPENILLVPLSFAGIYLGCVFAREGLRFVLGRIRNHLVQFTLLDIRKAMFEAIQRASFAFHDQTNTGELISRSTTDISRLQTFFHACLYMSLEIAVSIAVTMALIFGIHLALGFIGLLTMLPTVVLVAVFAQELHPRWRRVFDLNAEMTTVVQENIAGVRVVKGFAMEDDEIAKFHRKKEDFLTSLLSTVRFWAVRVPLAQFVYGLSVPLALWIGGQAVINETLSLGALVTVIFLLMGLGWRIALIGQFTNIVQTAGASAERVLAIIHEEPSITSGTRPLPEGGGAVEFDNVSFAYGPGSPTLSNISFKVSPGERIAVVGPTGAGKSSLLSLIPRFRDPSSGRVLVDGVDVRELDLQSLRRRVGVIFQETFLFAATIAQNIAYGQPDASREKIVHAAELAAAAEFIESLPSGYDTIIGERGVSLSGGQRQRIAIARALLLNPRILILDDATAAVDAVTERAIRDAIAKACVGRTVFVIAQRLSTIRETDRILVMNKGKIVAIGSHDELVRQEGFYRTIAQDLITDVPRRSA